MSLPLVLLAACSLYQSPGRKSLENSAYDIANGTASLVSCERNAFRSGTILRTDDTAEIRALDPWISVVLKQNPSFACDYQVSSVQAASAYLDELQSNTVSQLKNH